MLRCFIALIVCAWLIAGMSPPAAASDGVASDGKLSNTDLYNLTACGAVPGGPCQGPIVRWDQPIVSVAMPPADPAMEADLALQIDVASNKAIANLNKARAGIRLQRSISGKSSDITVYRIGLKEGERTRGIPGMTDGLEIGVGYMQIDWDDALRITDGTIIIAADIAPEDVASVVLEELTQSLGFLYDIENPYYEGVSIFSQDSNETVSITGQDRAILRLHYPAN